MTDLSRRAWLPSILLAAVAALTVGGLLRLATGGAAAWPAALAGLAAGASASALLAGRIGGGASAREACSRMAVLVALAALPGVLLAAAGSGAWRAEREVAGGEIDELCTRVRTMQLCRQEKLMGVFDFRDAPPAIVQRAAGEVAALTADQKLALCDRTFAGRMAGDAGGRGSLLARAGWAGLGLVLAALPTTWMGRRAGRRS